MVLASWSYLCRNAAFDDSTPLLNCSRALVWMIRYLFCIQISLVVKFAFSLSVIYIYQSSFGLCAVLRWRVDEQSGIRATACFYTYAKHLNVNFSKRLRDSFEIWIFLSLFATHIANVVSCMQMNMSDRYSVKVIQLQRNRIFSICLMATAIPHRCT